MSGRWAADECPDAQGHTAIRPDDGTANGDIDVQPIATVYDANDVPMIAAAPELVAALESLIEVSTLHGGLCEEDQAIIRSRAVLAKVKP